MTPYPPNLFLKDLVVESGFKFALATRGCCNIHGSLTTTENDKVFLGCDRCAVKRGVGYVGLHNLEILSIDELSQLAKLGLSDAWHFLPGQFYPLKQ
jgi:hypothetical protein